VPGIHAFYQVQEDVDGTGHDAGSRKFHAF
jgi:hypothetical protein